MANFNKVILLGNHTRDPELRYTQSGQAVVKLGLAVNRTYTVNNERKEETCFVDLTAWGKQAETINQYLTKGRPILVEGRLQYSTWDDKQTGQKRSKLDVVIENFQFVGGAREGGGPAGAGGGGGGGGARRGGRDEAEGAGEADYEGIPF